MTTGLLVAVAVLAALAALALFLQNAKVRAAAAASAGELAELRQKGEAARAEVAAARAEAKDRREEAGGLRAELNAARKKAFEQAEASKRSSGAAQLRTEIDKLTGKLAEARAEAAHHLERATGFETAVARQSAEVDKLRTELRAAVAAAAERKAERKAEPAAPPPGAPAATAPATAAAEASPEALAAERDRTAKAEAKLAEARKRITELEKDVRGFRGRLETERRVYMVQKGELELASDRHAELRRRHEALRKDHEELLEAVRQAAAEDRRLAEVEKQATSRAAPAAHPEGASGGSSAPSAP